MYQSLSIDANRVIFGKYHVNTNNVRIRSNVMKTENIGNGHLNINSNTQDTYATK